MIEICFSQWILITWCTTLMMELVSFHVLFFTGPTSRLVWIFNTSLWLFSYALKSTLLSTFVNLFSLSSKVPSFMGVPLDTVLYILSTLYLPFLGTIAKQELLIFRKIGFWGYVWFWSSIFITINGFVFDLLPKI